MGSKSAGTALQAIGFVAAIFVPYASGAIRIALIATTIGAGVGTGIIAKNLAKKQQRLLRSQLNGLDLEAGQAGFLVEKVGQNYIPICYGRCRIAGIRTYLSTSAKGNLPNAYLDIVESISEGEIQAIDDILLDNVSYTTASMGDQQVFTWDPHISSNYNAFVKIESTGTNQGRISIESEGQSTVGIPAVVSNLRNYLDNDVGIDGIFQLDTGGNVITNNFNKTFILSQNTTVSYAAASPTVYIDFTTTETITEETTTLSPPDTGQVITIKLLRSLVSGGSGNTADINLGTTTQTAFSNLITNSSGGSAEWTSNHKMLGVACYYMRLDGSDREKWRTFPIVESVVRGRLLYDPRTEQTTYSNNPALAIRDYLTNSIYGANKSTAFIDDNSFIQSANDCDSEGYKLDGVVSTSNNILSNIDDLKTACRGIITRIGGIYKLKIDKADASVFTFTKDNIISKVNIGLINKAERCNRLVVKYFNKDLSYQPDSIILESSTYKAIDGITLEQEIELPYTIEKAIAKKIGTIEINQTRKQILVRLSSTFEAINVECGDVVSVTYDDFGMNAKKFRITGMNIKHSKQLIDFTMIEYDASIYTPDNLAVSDSSADFSVTDFTAFPKSLIENPSFSGSKTNLEIANNALRLTDSAQEGVYDFSGTLDIGDILLVRLVLTARAVSTWDDIVNVDSVSNIDDIGTDRSEDVKAYYKSSDDNITYSDWVYFSEASDLIFSRYYQFKLVINSSNTNEAFSISSLKGEARLSF